MDHVCAIKMDDTLQCLGNDERGQATIPFKLKGPLYEKPYSESKFYDDYQYYFPHPDSNSHEDWPY